MSIRNSLLLICFYSVMVGLTCGQAPGTWSEWADNGCTDTCGLCGVVKQIRLCLANPCIGSAEQSTSYPCGDPVCIFPRTTCCPGASRGITNNTYACIPNLPIIRDAPPTPSLPVAIGTWGPWAESGCTDTCGMCGQVILTRACLGPGACNGNSTYITTKACGSNVCNYPRGACCQGIAGIINNGVFTCVPPSS